MVTIVDGSLSLHSKQQSGVENFKVVLFRVAGRLDAIYYDTCASTANARRRPDLRAGGGFCGSQDSLMAPWPQRVSLGHA